MKGLAQHQLTKAISLLIVVCLSFSPIANGSMLSASPSIHNSHASTDVEHQCNHAAKDSASAVSKNSQNNDGEHGSSCNSHSSTAIELSTAEVFILAQEKTITWSAMNYLNLKPSFLSRLDKPPKA
ncbi:MAG: hypothetical protein ACI8XX_002422 [Polaribacter sp.]|jgi:hypothetical protein